ncbi:HEPN domain-containing protein [Mucilaginibacter ginkgonis]|uniref:HEPN domain-containing protein n=1 Tax=Mucilaginibacter ginkgonis TaxID=2682091 RepID=A0A6I4HV93_9SPHI|nr:HEPN domain-containing protein [Mucilaginibacter ginkgonis]QQL50148.1 HEPN domain-containing protein [Mucilaginibacter ginkgonis]
MYNTRYTPFDHYPKFLSFNEIQNPLKPLYDFFTADSIKGHKAYLKEWRYYVINKDCFKGRKYGPGELLYEHELNIKMMEAAYLLMLSYNDISSDIKKVDKNQIKQEKKDWTYFPKNLRGKYLVNPYLALKKVFRQIKPQSFRDSLNMWLSDALHTKPTDEVTETAEIIGVYDNLKLLYDVTWLIYQRESDEPYLKDNYGSVAKVKKIARRLVLKELFPAVNEKDKSLLDKLVNFITERFPMIDMIFYPGKNDNPEIFYLVLIRNIKDTSDDGELGNKIEDHCKHLAEVFAIVHQYDTVVKGLESGARFWTKLVGKGEVLYQRDRNIVLPAPQQINNATLIDRAENKWARWGSQGDLFIAAAENLLKNRNELKKADLILACFMLNQATRNYLKAIIESVIGYRVQAHNLSRLLKLTLLLTNEIRAAFKLDTEEGVQLYTFIKDAGQKASYFEEYNPDEGGIRAGLKIVKRLALVSETVMLRLVQDLKNE